MNRLKELDENYPIEEQLEEALKYENIYKSRIDKAIKYIKDKYDDDLFDDTLTQFEDKLLSILEGKEVEDNE